MIIFATQNCQKNGLFLIINSEMVVFNRYIPFRGYDAINLFGIIFVRYEPKSPLHQRRIYPSLLNHERIHTRQQWELLWIGFYLWYLIEYLFYLIKYKSRFRAYRSIRFEREAYAYEHDLDYLRHRHLYAWIKL